VVADISHEGAKETASLIDELGGRALAVKCDVTNSADVRSALDATVAEFGRLDAAFNNAGLEHPLEPVAEIDELDWDRVIAVDLRGVFLCMKYEIPLMLKGGGGAIVNNSSAAGLVGFKGQAAYTAAKHGIIGLTKAAALDYADAGIRINAICPGIVDTPMMDRVTGETPEGRAGVIAMEPIGRMGRPEEVAAAAVWLCSDAAGFIVGQAMPVDGGMVAGFFGDRGR
jgi:NAD(P)-dependent dehydrogenase (short-subunit alcohol dehydrogenase family)